MKIAICDDDSLCLESAIKVMEEYIKDRQDIKIKYSVFSHHEDLLDEVEKNGGFDIYILDIVMPGMNGIALGKRLREEGYDGKIIYLTSSEEYAIDAFSVKAFHYIIKPIKKDVFYEVIDEAMALIEKKKDKTIIVKTRDRSLKLTLDSIMYAELSKRAVIYYLVGGRTVESMSLRTGFADSVSELLADSRFVLCGAGMAVNLDHLTAIESEALVFDNTYKPFLGKKACRELRGVWSDYLFNGEGSR